MPTITLFQAIGELNKEDLIKNINEKGESRITASENKFFKDEIVISYFFEENLEEKIRNIVEESEEIISIIKQNGKSKVWKKILAFLNVEFKILEVYRGPDKVTEEFISKLSNITGLKFVPFKLSGEELEKIYKQNSSELKQALFKNVDGMFYTIFRGNLLEANKRFLLYIYKYPQCLRVISIRPAIKFLNGGKYQVTINGDKGTIKFSSPSEHKWRPRFEIRQIVRFCVKVKKNESLPRYEHIVWNSEKTN